MHKALIQVLFIMFVFSGFPFYVLAAGEDKEPIFSSIADYIKPDKFFNAINKNITIPNLQNKLSDISSPDKMLKSAWPNIQETNKKIKEKIGIDFAKFFVWLVNILAALFFFLINLYQTIADALIQND